MTQPLKVTRLDSIPKIREEQSLMSLLLYSNSCSTCIVVMKNVPKDIVRISVDDQEVRKRVLESDLNITRVPCLVSMYEDGRIVKEEGVKLLDKFRDRTSSLDIKHIKTEQPRITTLNIEGMKKEEKAVPTAISSRGKSSIADMAKALQKEREQELDNLKSKKKMY